MIKKCLKCGSDNIDLAQFCQECGQDFKSRDKLISKHREGLYKRKRGKIVVLILLALVSILFLSKLHIVLGDSSLITVTWKKNPSFKNTILDLQTIEQKMAFIYRSGARGTDEINIIELYGNLEEKGILPTKTNVISKKEKSNANISVNSSFSKNSQVQQSTQIEEEPIATNQSSEMRDLHQIGRPAIIYAPGLSSDNVALWLTPVPYTGIASRYYEAKHHGSVQDGQRVTILNQVKRGQIAGPHSIKISGMTYTFSSEKPNVDDESLIETEDGVQGWIMTRYIKEVQNEDRQKHSGEETQKSQIPQISSLPPNLTLDENVWYTGTWNSNIYNRSEKPKTVGVRIELVNAETGMPISGARVYLRGIWLEERIGTSGKEVGIPYEPQEREFAMGAVTDQEGIIVFALAWEKEYPWRSGGPTNYDVHTSWIRAVDDIEKIQYIEVRHQNFRFVRAPLDFSQLLEFGQDKTSESQSPELFKQFENAWQSEMTKPGVKYCVMNFGVNFNDFGNSKSQRVEFFEKIKKRDFGTVYRQPTNWFSVGEYPQSECGPFFVYLLQLEIQGRADQMDVNIRRQRD